MCVSPSKILSIYAKQIQELTLGLLLQTNDGDGDSDDARVKVRVREHIDAKRTHTPGAFALPPATTTIGVVLSLNLFLYKYHVRAFCNEYKSKGETPL